MNPNLVAQIDSEIDTLAESYKDLQDAKQKFKESLEAIKVQRQLSNDKSILVPLTGSMYVPGYISNTQEYLIDIGTQYMVEKDADGAVDYFERKMKFIDMQLAKFSELLEMRLAAKQHAKSVSVNRQLLAAKMDASSSVTSQETSNAGPSAPQSTKS